ncbi:hypothetical protein HERIO_2425 [Hepatospora eriocheir]|nr:hypothetical protein HERIO_2425 [Hepatospora eriocheir]
MKVSRKGLKSIINYPLKTFKNQMEEEYNLVDSHKALSVHLNSRLNKKRLYDDEYFIMKRWNECMIKEKNPITALSIIFNEFGLILQTVKLMEILYERGVLNTKELVDILESLKGNFND